MIEKILVCFVALVLIGGVLVPIIDDSDSEIQKQDPNIWSYDDYKINGSVESVSGAIELVTVGSQTYLHANDLGDATLTFANGDTQQVTVQKAKLDVYVALGQSNNSFVNSVPTEASPVPLPGTTYYYGTEDDLIMGKSADLSIGDFQDVVDSSGDLKIGDKVPAFGAKYYDLTGVKTYYIDGAWPGSSVAWWQDTTSVVWTSAVSIVSYAMSKIPEEYYDVTVRGYTWIQGERDADNAVDVYIECFDTMNGRILNGDLGIDLDHCFMSKVRAANAPNPSIAQIQIAESNSTVTMCTTVADTFTVANGLMGSDDLHYSQKGNNIIGVDFAKSCAEYYYTVEIESLQLLNVIPVVVILSLVVAVAVTILRSREF